MTKGIQYRLIYREDKAGPFLNLTSAKVYLEKVEPWCSWADKVDIEELVENKYWYPLRLGKGL